MRVREHISRGRRLAATVAAVAFAGVLVSCPNELTERIAEDVLVAESGGRPRVTGRVPAPDATDVVGYDPIRITFDMNLDASSVDADSIVVYPEGAPGNPVAGSFGYNRDTRTVTFTPAGRMNRETEYRIEVRDSIRNAGGASMDQTVSWSFETADVNPDEVRIDLTSDLTPAVSAGAPLYLSVTFFPIDAGNIKNLGPYTDPNQTLVFNQESDLFGSEVDDFVFFVTHDQNGDLDLENIASAGTDPRWIYLAGADGNAIPELFNGITEFNGENLSVEANPELRVAAGDRVSFDLSASPADDFPGSYDSSSGADFLAGDFVDLGQAPVTTAYIATTESRYDVHWYEFTVPSGGGGDYVIKTQGVSDTVELYHSITLYEYDGGGSPPGPSKMGEEVSTYSESSKVGYAVFNTSDHGGPLTADTTYYMSIMNFWADSYGTPRGVYEGARYELTITAAPSP